jgi:hypothetical protein
VADPDAEFARDLIQRHFGPCSELDGRYVGDITYVSTWEGWTTPYGPPVSSSLPVGQTHHERFAEIEPLAHVRNRACR